ncbi:MAG: alpha/beta fold hydrolase [Longimicrobiales bacterium]
MSLQSARAWVHDGVRQIEYVRAGAGRTVILLDGSAANGSVSLFTELARDFRVIQPEGHPAVSDLSWLAGFLDALGMTQVSLVANGEHALAALRFTLTESDRVERLAILMSCAADPQDTQPLSDILVDRKQPLLLIACPEGEPTEEQRQALAGFLTRTTTPFSRNGTS